MTVLDGTVIGQHASRHRHREFPRFLNRIAHTIPAGVPVYAILDNDATHKYKDVQVWLARHPRWTFHVTPTSSAWLNALEGVFAKLTRRRLKYGVCCSGRDLQDAIRRVIDEHNTTEAKPFVWTADPDTIIAAREKEGSKCWDQSTRSARRVGCVIEWHALLSGIEVGSISAGSWTSLNGLSQKGGPANDGAPTLP